MERRGHARRRPHPTDGRASLVTLTAAGLRVHREANARFEGAYRAFVAALPMRETEARRALTTLRDAAIRASKGVQPEGHTPSRSR